ncbi:phosphoethanolamine transferase [Glaesserella parasuis]|uniref:phosphoethanolamine transferase n=1 Tax=Glaesserella parasuis TaxID=738 RepID=UPI003B684763
MNITKILATLISFGLAYLVSYLMLLGSGFFPNPEISNVLLLVLVILFANASKKTFFYLLLPIVTLYALYTPIGLTFGPPSYQYVASVFATDIQESKEFFSQIPLINFVACTGIFILLLGFRFISQKWQIQFHKNKTFLALGIALVFISTPPFKFLQEGSSAISKVKAELDRLNSMSIQSEWGTSQLNAESRYDDYILVIGESARKDYHHAYGYPAENTPFMSSANGILIDGLTAGGTNTIASLKLMLTKPDTEKWEGEYSLGMIDLIKSAGIKTYWLSNQGYLGTFDTPVSSLANKSDEKLFLKSGDSFHQNISDFDLLPKFEHIIEQKTHSKRFVVVHLYGSHPISCDRLTDYPKMFDDEKIGKKYFNVNCYASSIKKTDEVLKRLYETLRKNEQQSNRSFSVVYFADHGLAHHITENDIAIHNSSGKSKLHFDVPLFKISSDDTDRKVYKAMKSGLNFTDGIAKWVGISNPKLNTEVDLFSPHSDKEDYGLKKLIDGFEGKVDPAVVIPKDE